MLLNKSDLDQQVNNKICGLVARVGGCADQLFKYENCIVEDINVADGGYGRVRSGFNAILNLKKNIRQEIKFKKHGWKVPRDRKTILMDMHYAYKAEKYFSKYNAILSSNVIEHSPNPIWLLLNFHFLTQKDGYQFHAIPNYQFTFDMYRQPTELKHFVDDFEKLINRQDTQHTEDYAQSAIEKHGWQKKFHQEYPLTYPFIHFHVFDEKCTKELFTYIFEDVVTDVIRTEEFGDNLVLCRNTLKKSFVEKYGDLMNTYKKEFQF